MRMVQQPSGAATSFTPTFDILGVEIRVEFRDTLTHPGNAEPTPIDAWIDCPAGVMLISRRQTASSAMRAVLHEFTHGFVAFHREANPDDAEHVADWGATFLRCFSVNVFKNFGDFAAFGQWVERNVMPPQLLIAAPH